MELLTVNETAQLLRVAPLTVRRYVASGRLAAVKVGKAVRIRKEALERFVRPVQAKKRERIPRGRPLTYDDPMWELVGAFASAEPTDASKKLEYLAEALAPKSD